MKQIKADKSNYGGWRNRAAVTYICIHNTGVNGDTAEGNGRYFCRPVNPKASAHFFIDQKGNVVKSVALDHIAWSVGGKKWTDCKKTGGGTLYGKCTNRNSVSIELCDIVNKDPSAEQIKATREVIKYIQKYCPNAKTIIRHFDVNGKHCPVRFMDQSKWKALKKELI